MRAANILFAQVFEDPESYLSAPPDDDYLTELLANPDFIMLAAFQADDIVGALAAYGLPKFEQARREVYIYDLAVRAEHRRVGVGTALIEALKPIAREMRAWMIFVQADPPDEPAVALYDKLGVRESVLHFDISPDGDR
ncbi:GNAT family N-acetyltransferase [Sphingomonas sp. LY29]|uniref:GNAT family N-acetyltransferase n=1 Tax=Sphingomonas sp. LY29 TaxID=3095341 RepID=UPI002D7A33DF|nr:GNAT family N-acetyltransferase [Sphingomonas sp. LY29]WRP27035.1 GNAT family N-acetyltransferase [Sphingomonas sp. LY29]